jgi:hypothetical protein
MYDWTFTDLDFPLPDNKAEATAHQQELIAEIIMIRDQLDAVSNGDATPPSDTWAFEATTYRRLLQGRCNAINVLLKSLPKELAPQQTKDKENREEKRQRQAEQHAHEQAVIDIKEREKTKRIEISANRDLQQFNALKGFVKELGDDIWDRACAAMNAEGRA